MIVKILDPSPFTEKIDALSRVKLFGSNAMDSSEIIRFGNVTQISGGGITCGSGRFALQPSFWGGQMLVEQNENGSRTIFPTQDACPIDEMLAGIAGTADTANHCLMLCRKLRLKEKDPDLADGFWKRCFCDSEQPIPPQATALDYYTNGAFDCREEFLNINGFATVLEVKFFKTINAPGVLKLYLEPNHSRLWSDKIPTLIDTPVFITSEIGTVLDHPEGGFCWFQNCGDLEKIDFSRLQSYRPGFLTMEFPNDALRTCNSFREALAFKTAAIRHGISVAITVASLQNEKHLNVFCGKSYEDSKLKNLDDEEFFQQCAQYRLSIDPILRGNPYEVKLHSNETRRRELLPFFFDQGLLTLFLEQPETPSIRRELLSLLSGKKAFDRHPSTSISTLLFLHRGKIHRQKRLIQGQNWPQLKVYADAALLASGTSAPDEMKKLLDELRPKLVLLDISGYFTAPEENALMAAMDVCLENGVAVGIFGEDGNTPTAWRAMSDRELIIGNVNESTFIVKEKTASPPAIRRFDFSENTIIVTDATEEDLAETMRYQEEMITE